MRLLIKNMVCRHCVESVRRVFDSVLGLPVESVELGAVTTCYELSEADLDRVASALEAEGFELIVNREAELIESVKRRLIEESRREGGPSAGISEMLSSGFNISYPTISRIFSSVEGRSIENYLMSLRIERVKELIKYERSTLAEIADMTGFSSTAHLSNKFKAVTGLTPTEFRRLGMRKPLPDV
ncbi:MAG: helix-turn-helix domain-containing protein [Bacteroidales bacterium]|nr:helix-turn-helix domain-containing protein [Bacteroidales bacterium]